MDLSQSCWQLCTRGQKFIAETKFQIKMLWTGDGMEKLSGWLKNFFDVNYTTRKREHVCMDCVHGLVVYTCRLYMTVYLWLMYMRLIWMCLKSFKIILHFPFSRFSFSFFFFFFHFSYSFLLFRNCYSTFCSAIYFKVNTNSHIALGSFMINGFYLRSRAI